MIFDSHVHTDPDKFSTPLEGASYLYKNFSKQVQGMLLLGLKELKCSNADLAKIAEDPDYKKYFVLAGSIENLERDHIKQAFETYFKSGIFRALHLHPRLQGFSITDERVHWMLKEFELYRCPIIVDSFFDGHQIVKEGDPLRNLIAVIEKFPRIPFVIAHGASYEIFRTLRFAKTFKNIYFDLSFSLLYYRESSLLQDFIYSIKSMHGARVLFGTDYPDRPYEQGLEMSLDLLKKSDLSKEQLANFMADNARMLFGVS